MKAASVLLSADVKLFALQKGLPLCDGYCVSCFLVLSVDLDECLDDGKVPEQSLTQRVRKGDAAARYQGYPVRGLFPKVMC